ncbi:unnamed protein product [Pleuronectes platessa]|uniref:Uncharacterized protein n=1 Tax=Pleuronectes platessa TaxID=8262 RepID=A0A9N7ULM0_PLEPL|nr:unnamed protein product [Pleuronectes platessa]
MKGRNRHGGPQLMTPQPAKQIEVRQAQSPLQKIVPEHEREFTEGTIRTGGGMKPTCAFLAPFFLRTWENDVFVCHIALDWRASHEQDALKKHGFAPAPEKKSHLDI